METQTEKEKIENVIYCIKMDIINKKDDLRMLKDKLKGFKNILRRLEK
jgi:hypothetical protein